MTYKIINEAEELRVEMRVLYFLELMLVYMMTITKNSISFLKAIIVLMIFAVEYGPCSPESKLLKAMTRNLLGELVDVESSEIFLDV